MKILAIEFSSAERSVAIVEGSRGEIPSRKFSNLVVDDVSVADNSSVLGRAFDLGGRNAIGLIEQALAKSNCRREEIDVIGVGLGPGSYTGIRGAIALAQGWQIGRGTKLLGVSSVECLAAQSLESGISDSVHVVIDAQRNEFYLATYQIEGSTARQLQPLRLAALTDIDALAGRGELILGPEIVKRFPKARNMNPDAAMLGRIALNRSNFVGGENLEPIYLRETSFKRSPPLRPSL